MTIRNQITPNGKELIMKKHRQSEIRSKKLDKLEKTMTIFIESGYF